jgi:ribonuclease HII
MENIDFIDKKTSKVSQGSFKKDLFEREAWQKGQVIIGVDEVGRGCLAGPLVTAAVAIKTGKTSRLLKDSKLLDPEQREKAFAWIVENAVYSVGIVNHQVVDDCNIWQATLKTMKKAVLHLGIQLPKHPEAILVDAMPLRLSNTSYAAVPVHHFPFGESKSSSIAAASIVAKVTRDRLMQLIDPLFRCYNLARHKGYATKEHQKALEMYGNSIIHRKSFIVAGLDYAKQLAIEESDYDYQQTMW